MNTFKRSFINNFALCVKEICFKTFFNCHPNFKKENNGKSIDLFCDEVIIADSWRTHRVYVFHEMCSNTERVTVIRNQNKFGFYLVTLQNRLINWWLFCCKTSWFSNHLPRWTSWNFGNKYRYLVTITSWFSSGKIKFWWTSLCRLLRVIKFLSY